MTATTPLTVLRADERGTTALGWLHSRHSFSFGQYRDPDRMGFRSLRVLNDDVVAPGGGFGEHGHADMEILTWVLDGGLRHADSTGGGGVITPGDVQVMTAGAGVHHSEMNASATAPVRFIQIWIRPSETGATPRYGQRTFDAAGRANRWQMLAGGAPEGDAMPIHQDAALFVADLDAGATLAREVPRFGYLHVATGTVNVNGTELREGDAIQVESATALEVTGVDTAQLLYFDLA